LVREVPEAKKPRRIQIATSARPSAPVIEGDVRKDEVQQAA
jgi:molecular chaperone IbpA